MSLAYTHGSTLPWTSPGDEERRFRLISLIVIGLTILFGVAIPFIDLPEKQRPEREKLPPRLAQLILEEKPKPPPAKPKEIIVPEKPKPKPKPVAKKKPKPVKKPARKIAKKKVISSPEAARKKAASAGLLAFSDDLADLRDDPGVTSVQRVNQLSKAGNRATTSERAIITSGVSKGSAGINTSKLSRDTGNQGLSGRKTTEVTSTAVRGNGGGGQNAARKGKDYRAQRTAEEIQLVFDQNKGAVYALYHRALRKDPTLRGKVLLELTIAESGKVTACRIVSSELNDSNLERKLISRVKTFKFPSKDVDRVTVTYPIDFLPS